MSVKEKLKTEKSSLMNKTRPYETVAFIIFAILFLQQIALLFVSLYRFATGGVLTFFSMANQTTPGFFGRIIAIDNQDGFIVFLAFLAYLFFYAIIYVFVFSYCERHGYAKWTWTLLVVFGPNIFLISPLYIYAAFVFRPYLFSFMNTMIAEFKEHKPATKKVAKTE